MEHDQKCLGTTGQDPYIQETKKKILRPAQCKNEIKKNELNEYQNICIKYSVINTSLLKFTCFG